MLRLSAEASARRLRRIRQQRRSPKDPNVVAIAVINESTAATDAQVQAIMAALQTQWNRDLAPVWNIDTAVFTFVPKGQAPPPTSWQCVFLDDSDQAGALAYHDLTNTGLPLSKIFVKTLMSDNSSISVGASHECCEMAVDPTINLAAQDASGAFWAYEVADPFEDDQYGYQIGGILVSDFATPAWFGFADAGTRPVDFMKHGTAAFQVLSGGYAQKYDPASGWTQINGAEARIKARKYVLTAPKGSRRDRRVRGSVSFQKSARKFV